TLHLKTMAEILEETLKKGAQENLSAADLFLILTSQEIASREQRRVKTRISSIVYSLCNGRKGRSCLIL
ncbi:MAG: hypothetical protein ACXWQR_19930, partial [Ktedonobacterales bacterium]